ncbi:MAG: hypothetical protein LBV18_07530 [Alistipes sp.]|jgi:hypothetical protein|nr:hypothetical protein [Alistipes sp.]
MKDIKLFCGGRALVATAWVALLSAATILSGCEAPSDGGGSPNGVGNESSQGGSMARFTINGDYLYTVDDQNLNVFSIVDPTSPLDVNDVRIGIDIETIFTMDNFLFVGSRNAMYIYDVTNPAFPNRLSMVSHFRSCDPVVAYGNLAFVTLNSDLGWWCGNSGNVLQVYDITDIEDPIRLSEVSMSSPRGLAVDGQAKMVFVCDNDMVKAYDISDPNDLKGLYVSSTIPELRRADAYDCIALDGRLLVIGADGLYQLGYDREKFTFISKIDLRTQL